MIKPILLFAGAVPVILAVLIIIPLITSTEIPRVAIDPDDNVQIESVSYTHLTLPTILRV